MGKCTSSMFAQLFHLILLTCLYIFKEENLKAVKVFAQVVPSSVAEQLC